MKIGKAIKALKEGYPLARGTWNENIYLELSSGCCPENSGKVEDFIGGVSINMFNISTNIDTTIIFPSIIEVNVDKNIVKEKQFTIEDILAEDWYLA